MAAAAVVFQRLAPGSHICVPSDPYHGVAGIVDEGEQQGRWTVERLDQGDTATWISALQRSDLVWLESPENPLITVADLPAICGAPRPAGTIVAVDSTFATPLNQQPLGYGADVVMHSATKFIGGHSDLLAGVLVTRDDDLHAEFHRRRLLHGATIGAMEAFLTIRGARTLALRLERSQSNAMELATRLSTHPQVAAVRYPGLVSHPSHAVAAGFMNGFGAVLSFETTGSGERATAVCERVELINHATSLGGVESTMERRASLAGQERIPPTLIRFSVGCENVEDLWADLDRALRTTVTPGA
jgi:cystathionine gamma-synthase